MRKKKRKRARLSFVPFPPPPLVRLGVGRGKEGKVELLCTNESTARKKDGKTERAGVYSNQHYSTRNKSNDNRITITKKNNKK